VRFSALTLLVLTGVTMAAPARAVPPTYCRERLVGVLRHANGNETRVRFRLRVRDDVGDLSLDGRFRCSPRKWDDPCIVEAGRVTGSNRSGDPGGFGYTFDLRVFAVGANREITTLCVFSASASFVFNNCIPAMAGSYVCTDGGLETDRGIFGLAAERCDRCPTR